MKNNLKEIQVFYRFLYRSFAINDYYERAYYNLWQYYRSKVRDLYIGRLITYNGEKFRCNDILSYNGSFVLHFKTLECDGPISTLTLNVEELEGISFE